MKHEMTDAPDVTQVKNRSGKISVLFLCMTLAVLTAGNFAFAKLRSTTTGSSTGEVAVYAVSATSTDSQSLAISCNGTGSVTDSYLFTVANQDNNTVSEVSMEYGIQVSVPSSLPEGVSLKIDDVTATVSADRKTFSFQNNAWAFQAGSAGLRQHTLTFTADADVINKDYAITGIQISVKTVQSD